MKKVIIYFLLDSQDNVLISTVREMFKKKDVHFIEMDAFDNFIENNFFNENKLYLESCKVAIIDSQPQCCTLMLTHHIAMILKDENKSNKILAILQEKPVSTKDIDSIFICKKFSGNTDSILGKLNEWFVD
ncbi:MAG: hypothetical protein V4439_02735 [Patescibacteria group bacterium]